MTSIPNQLHFIWFGEHLPCFAAVAMKSALAHNPSAKVKLWHEPKLRPDLRVEALEHAGVDCVVLDVDGLLARARAMLDDPRALDRIWRALTAPAARSNVV